MVVEVGQWHAMTAAPRALGYPGHAVVMEISGHRFDPAAAGKTLAPFAPALEGGINGDPSYFAEQLLPLCPNTRDEHGLSTAGLTILNTHVTSHELRFKSCFPPVQKWHTKATRNPSI
eukprot:scaffold33992_cov59-Phaeocystis_antarctica.AAC.5